MSTAELRWTRVLVHHSATHDGDGLDYRSIRSYHVDHQGWQDIGYHAVVERVGDRVFTIPGRPTTMVGSHCPGQNSTALGICLVGNFDLAPPSEALLEEAAETIAGWVARFGIAVGEIRAHREFKSTDCPGAHFPLADLRQRVARIVVHG